MKEWSGNTVWQRWVRGGLLALSAVLASFLVYLLVTNSTTVPAPTAAAPGSMDSADATISQFTFTQTKGDTVQWQVQAQEARLFERERRAMLRVVEVTLFGQQGKDLTVTGDEGTLNTETKNFVLANRSEPLVIRTESGYVIYTNHLAWTDETREIRTQDPVRIVGHGLEVRGRGLLGHLDREEFEVLEDVHVDLAPAS
ncbi:MAG TPA: LPS export ABC transporter periplasmic protein LptC [Nitrospiraceae bacterium]|nr:LPS export ABC transporter periplasmic protein LptC [Nitrospiraceae bacterium]